MILFIGVWQGAKYASLPSFVYEIMLAIDDFSSKSDSSKFDVLMITCLYSNAAVINLSYCCFKFLV